MAKKDSSRPQFQAALTDAQVENIEKKAQAFGVWRRTGLATLARTSEELLVPMDEATGEVLLEAAKTIAEYLHWRKDETRLLEDARARLLIVLQWQAEHGSLREVAHG